MTIEGFVAPGWEGVRDCLRRRTSSVTARRSAPAQRCTTVARTVVDLTGGWFDEAQHASVRRRRAAAGVQHHQGHHRDRGGDLRATWTGWPTTNRSAATGPSSPRTRRARQRSRSCSATSAVCSACRARSRSRRRWTGPTITERLADTKPEWPIGSTHGYHAVTYGFLAGELVRRVDPEHRSIGRFVQDEIAGPLDVEFYIGLPEELEPRVSPIVGRLMATKSEDPDGAGR